MSLFFALWPDEALRQQIVERRDQLKTDHKGVSGAWFGTDCYHLTVQDISVLGALLPKALSAAADVQAAPFNVLLDHAAGFEGAHKRYRWMLSSKAVPAGLKDLRRQLLDSLRRQGCSPKPTTDRPHLTLHYNAGRQLPERPVAPLTWSAQEFALLQGVDDRERGFRYDVLGRWPLTAPGEPDHARQFDLWDNPG
jgi:2'-5' RNA ligase